MDPPFVGQIDDTLLFEPGRDRADSRISRVVSSIAHLVLPGLAARTPWPGGWENRLVDAGLLEVRNVTYRTFVELGRAPSAEEVAAAADRTSAEVEAVWRELHRAHALVLNPATNEIRMANPFSAVPTAYRVQAAGRWWYGNCAWDALGICAALRTDGRVETSCPDCGEAIAFDVRGQRPDEERLMFHCLVPAAHWWDDIIFT